MENRLVLSDCREVRTGAEAALLDLGDGIGCLQFRSRGNCISPPVKEFILETLEQDLYGFQGLVIGSQDKNFSVGASLYVMKQNLDKKDYGAFDRNVRSMQAVTSAIRHYSKPIVAAPYRRVLGGGLETVLHCHTRVARQDCMMGLVEVGVGLVPAGGGTKECALLVGRAPEEERPDVLKTVFRKLLLRQVSVDAQDAVQMLYLSSEDKIAEPDEDLLSAAKARCLQMVGKPAASAAQARVVLPGRDAYRWMTDYAEELLSRGEITPYDFVIGQHLARILAGSDTSGPAEYREQQLLDMEREAFIALAKQQGTYDRITYFTEHNSLLRN